MDISTAALTLKRTYRDLNRSVTPVFLTVVFMNLLKPSFVFYLDNEKICVNICWNSVGRVITSIPQKLANVTSDLK